MTDKEFSDGERARDRLVGESVPGGAAVVVGLGERAVHDYVELVENTDDLHCVPAALLTLARRLNPSLGISMDEFSGICQFSERGGAWPYAGVVWLCEYGSLSVKMFDSFDVGEFAEKGEDYIREISTDGSIADECKNRYDLSAIQVSAARIIELGIWEHRAPNWDDVKDLLKDGYLLAARVSPALLRGEENIYPWWGHEVIVVGYNEEGVIVDDPRKTPQYGVRYSREVFEAAWTFDGSKELIAVKLTQ